MYGRKAFLLRILARLAAVFIIVALRRSTHNRVMPSPINRYCVKYEIRLFAVNARPNVLKWVRSGRFHLGRLGYGKEATIKFQITSEKKNSFWHGKNRSFSESRLDDL